MCCLKTCRRTRPGPEYFCGIHHEEHDTAKVPYVHCAHCGRASHCKETYKEWKTCTVCSSMWLYEEHQGPSNDLRDAFLLLGVAYGWPLVTQAIEAFRESDWINATLCECRYQCPATVLFGFICAWAGLASEIMQIVAGLDLPITILRELWLGVGIYIIEGVRRCLSHYLRIEFIKHEGQWCWCYAEPPSSEIDLARFSYCTCAQFDNGGVFSGMSNQVMTVPLH